MEVLTTVEGIIINSGDGGGDCDGGEAGAVCESMIADGGDGGRNLIFTL